MFGLWDYELREPAIHADQQLGENPNRRLIQVPQPQKMNAHFSAKVALIQRVARFAGHICTPRKAVDEEKGKEINGLFNLHGTD